MSSNTLNPEAVNPGTDRWRQVLTNPVVIAGALALVLIGIGQAVSPGFAAPSQLVSLLRVASFLGIIAIGQTIVILSGGTGIDLSVGKMATFAAVISSRFMQGEDSRLLAGVVIALVVCAALGLVNGLGIRFLRIPPFVMTLGMLGVIQGLVLAYTGGVADGRAAPILLWMVNGNLIGAIPGVVVIWVLLTIVVTFALRRTRQGWNLYAVGMNRETARLSGLKPTSTVLGAYVASAVFAGLGGILMVGYTESVFLNLADAQMLPSVAAVIIGGTLIAGGVGSYLGTAVGAVVLTVLTSLLTTLDMSTPTRTAINGVVLLVLLALYGRQRRLRS